MNSEKKHNFPDNTVFLSKMYDQISPVIGGFSPLLVFKSETIDFLILQRHFDSKLAGDLKHPFSDGFAPTDRFKR